MADQHGGAAPPIIYGQPLTWVDVQAGAVRYSLGIPGHYLQAEIIDAYRATLIGQTGWEDRVTVQRHACHLCGATWGQTGCVDRCNANTWRLRA